ncbi:hypothetical protein SADUNF_Sadunf14G0018400 [Salix dunnii]|uniref:EF-hand domain-containing protein n=1 Tax=Salix dunnii TaxID=1413687 RepID=A0A835JHR9_9ROSI|nr:hypothetical protein SADUNF_Sadunf14G0018400 [Salix dunnii]
MVIKTSCISVDGKRVMSIEEFWRWIRTFDADKDGKISRIELEDAMSGGWFTRWKGKRRIRSADSDGNGFIEESDINNLVEIAQKYLGVTMLSGDGVPRKRGPNGVFSSGHCWEPDRFKSSKVKRHKSNLGFRSLSIPKHSFISWWPFILDCRLESLGFNFAEIQHEKKVWLTGDLSLIGPDAIGQKQASLLCWLDWLRMLRYMEYREKE